MRKQVPGVRGQGSVDPRLTEAGRRFLKETEDRPGADIDSIWASLNVALNAIKEAQRELVILRKKRLKEGK